MRKEVRWYTDSIALYTALARTAKLLHLLLHKFYFVGLPKERNIAGERKAPYWKTRSKIKCITKRKRYITRSKSKIGSKDKLLEHFWSKNNILWNYSVIFYSYISKNYSRFKKHYRVFHPQTLFGTSGRSLTTLTRKGTQMANKK